MKLYLSAALLLCHGIQVVESNWITYTACLAGQYITGVACPVAVASCAWLAWCFGDETKVISETCGEVNVSQINDEEKVLTLTADGSKISQG